VLRLCYLFAVRTVAAVPLYARGIASVADLLTRLRIDFIFAGGVARAAWLGGEMRSGSIDVIAVMKPEQKNQVAMMAKNRDFRVDPDQIAQSEELDLVPLTYHEIEGTIRVHVLVASNALYGTMVAKADRALLGELEVKIPPAEDMALLLAMSEDEEALRALIAAPHFDRDAYNRKLISIGLREHVI